MTKTLKKLAAPKNRVVSFAETNGKPKAGKPDSKPLFDVVAPLSADIFSGFIGGKWLPNPDEILQRQSKGKNIELYTTEMPGRDSTVYASVQNLQHSLSVLRWKIVPASSEEADIRVADDVRGRLERINNFHEDLFEFASCGPVGFALSEIFWKIEKDGKVGVDRIDAVHQRRAQFSADGMPLVFDIKHPFPGTPLPDRKFIVCRYGAIGENPYGDPILLHCYWPYWFKKGGYKFWSVFLERFGQPAIDASYKTASGSADEEKSELKKILDDWQNGTALSHSDNIVVTLLEAAKSGTASYDGFIKTMNEEIVKTVLLQAVMTEQTQPGSQMSPKTAQVVWQNRISSLAKTVASALNASLIRWLVDFNFGEDVDAPKFSFETEPDEDLNVRAARDEKLARMGLPVAKQYFYDTYKIPVPAKGDELLEVPASGFGVSDEIRQTNLKDKTKKIVHLKVRVPEPPRNAIGRYDVASVARVRRRFADQLDHLFKSLEPGLQSALASNRPVLSAMEDYIAAEMPQRLAIVLYNGNLESLKRAAESMASRLSLTVNEARFTELAAQYARVHAYDLGAAKEMTATVKDALSEWISGQANLEDIRDGLMEKFADLSQGRAETIAVTETQKAANWAATEIARESGLDLEAWFVGDSTDEPLCLDLMAGNPYPLNGIEVGDIPHPNCQHRWIFAKKTEE